MAQLVERLLCKEKVRSSNLLGSTERDVGVSFEVRRTRLEPTARRPNRVQPASTLHVLVRARPRFVVGRERADGEPLQVKRKTKTSFANSEVRTDRQLIEESAKDITGPSWVRLDAGLIRSSYKGRTVNALALEADEGRGYLRKDPGSW